MQKHLVGEIDPAVLYVYVPNGEKIPWIKIQPNNGRDEQEYLISPFCEIKEKKHISTYNGYEYYRLELKERNFEEVDKEELLDLEKTIFNTIEKNVEKMQKSRDIKMRIEQLEGYIKDKNISQELINKFREDQKSAQKDLYETSKEIDEFRKVIQKYFEGSFKSIEIELDEAKKVIDEFDEISKLEDGVKNTIKKINTSIDMTKEITYRLEEFNKIISNQNDKIKKVSKELKIQCNDGYVEEFKEKIILIKKLVEDKSNEIQSKFKAKEYTFESLRKINEEIDFYLFNLQNVNKVFKELMHENSLNSEKLEQDIKEKIYNRAIEIINNAKRLEYNKQKANIENTKIGFFGGLLGKKRLKEEQIKHLDLLLEEINIKDFDAKDERYSIRNTLAELYIAINYDLKDAEKQKVVDYYEDIKNVFNVNENSKILADAIMKFVNKKLSQKRSLLPVQANKNTNRNKLKLLIEENRMLEQSNERKKSYRPKKVVENKGLELNYYKMNNKVKGILTSLGYTENNKQLENDVEIDLWKSF